MTALQPWSGSFGTFAKDGSWTAGPMVWATAHTTQFSEPGSWAYLAVAANSSDARASGAGMLAGGGSFVTLKNFATGDFSIGESKPFRPDARARGCARARMRVNARARARELARASCARISRALLSPHLLAPSCSFARAAQSLRR